MYYVCPYKNDVFVKRGWYRYLTKYIMLKSVPSMYFLKKMYVVFSWSDFCPQNPKNFTIKMNENLTVLLKNIWSFTCFLSRWKKSYQKKNHTYDLLINQMHGTYYLVDILPALIFYRSYIENIIDFAGL